MTLDPVWIDVPPLLDDRQLALVTLALQEAGLAYTSEVVPVSAGRAHQTVKFALHLRRDQAEPAVKVLARALDLEDPEDARPFSGPCPACGIAVNNAWSCPSCAIAFRPPIDPDDLMIPFVRKYRGFQGR